MLMCAGAMALASCGSDKTGGSDAQIAKVFIDSVQAANVQAAKAEAGEATAAGSDSLSGNMLTTPDLCLYDVHGDVKTLAEAGRIVHFSEAGEWTNAPAVVKRAPDGKIMKTSVAANAPDYETSYLWNGDNVIKISSSSHCIDRTYGSDGLVQTEVEVNTRTSGVKITYSDYKFDRNGNWIERTASRSYYKGGQGKNTERRQIKYYSDDVKKGKDAKEATDSLTFAEYLEQKKAFEKKAGASQASHAVMEDTQWLDGIWKLDVKESTAKGIVPLKFTLVIDAKAKKLTYKQDDKKLYAGPYTLTANYIRFGEYALPLDEFTSVVKFADNIDFRPSTR